MTARGNSVTAAEGPGPWLEIAGPNDRWAAGTPVLWSLLQPGGPRGRGSTLEAAGGTHHRYFRELPPGSVPGSPLGGATKPSLRLAKLSETTEAGRIALSFS